MRVRMFGGNAPATARSAVSLLALLSAVSGLRAQEATPVPDVTVVAPAPQSPSTSGEQKLANGNPGSAPAVAAAGSTAPPAPEGSEAAGYKPATVSNLGPLGRLQAAASGAGDLGRVLSGLPAMAARSVAALEQFEAITRDGLVLSPQTIAAMGQAGRRGRRWEVLALWVIALSLFGLFWLSR